MTPPVTIRVGTENGDLPEQDTTVTARSVMALIEGTVLLAKMEDNPELLNGLEDQALRLIGFNEEKSQ